jgi:hypothetical protein
LDYFRVVSRFKCFGLCLDYLWFLWTNPCKFGLFLDPLDSLAPILSFDAAILAKFVDSFGSFEIQSYSLVCFGFSIVWVIFGFFAKLVYNIVIVFSILCILGILWILWMNSFDCFCICGVSFRFFFDSFQPVWILSPLDLWILLGYVRSFVFFQSLDSMIIKTLQGFGLLWGILSSFDASFGFNDSFRVVSVVSMLWILFGFCLDYLSIIWINPLDGFWIRCHRISRILCDRSSDSFCRSLQRLPSC